MAVLEAKRYGIVVLDRSGNELLHAAMDWDTSRITTPEALARLFCSSIPEVSGGHKARLHILNPDDSVGASIASTELA